MLKQTWSKEWNEQLTFGPFVKQHNYSISFHFVFNAIEINNLKNIHMNEYWKYDHLIMCPMCRSVFEMKKKNMCVNQTNNNIWPERKTIELIEIWLTKSSFTQFSRNFTNSLIWKIYSNDEQISIPLVIYAQAISIWCARI